MPEERGKKFYYEAYEKNSDWYWKIYHYDAAGQKEIVVHRSPSGFDTEPEAEDACIGFMDDNSIEAELG